MSEKEIDNNVKFFDNKIMRAISSEDFHFVLDKDSGVSICWGSDENEDPIYDPISPQQITFQIDDKTNIIDLYNQFNILADIRYKPDNKEFVNVPLFTKENIESLIKDPTLTSMSTTNSIQFNIKTNKIKELQKFSSYLKKFNIKVLVQLNEDITLKEIQLLKFITSDVSINLNYGLNNYKLLKENNFSVEVRLYIEQNNFKDIMTYINQLDKNTLGIIFFKENINITNLRELEGRIKNLKLNISIHSCNLKCFNKGDKIIKHDLQIINCDATTYSIYIKNGQIFSCMFSETPLAKFTKTSKKNELWYNKDICEFRQKIINDSFC